LRLCLLYGGLLAVGLLGAKLLRFDDTQTWPAPVAAASLGQLPLSFEANHGQAASAGRFLARGTDYALLLATDAATLQLGGKRAVSLRWLDANPQPDISALDPLPGRSNYFIGNDPQTWRSGIEQFARVRYQQVYPGVELIFYGQQRRLEYDFVLAPGADPTRIRLAFDGADKLSLAANGDLLVQAGDETLRQHKPVAYQQTASGRAIVPAAYRLDGQNRVSFELGVYDRCHTLVIDPILSYATYLGGSSTDIGHAIAVDREGAIYVTGQTYSLNFPVRAPYDTQLDGANDAFVLKLDPTGATLLFSTYIGGRGSYDRGLGIAVDNAGNVYFVGETNSLNFPTVNAAQAVPRGNGDGFAVKLNIGGSVLLYSTFLGGTLQDAAFAVALDRFDNAYITGRTDSTNFPTKNAVQPSLRGTRDAFVLRLDPDGVLVTSSYFGGEAARDDEAGLGIAVDRWQRVYVTGYTASSAFPTVNALQRDFGGVEDAFLVKFDLNAPQVLFSTFLGGSRADGARGIALDSFGNPYITGYTLSANFPPQNALQSQYGGNSDAFVSKLNANGTALIFSTFLGGESAENTGLISDQTPVGSVVVDALGSAYVTGKTESANFPVARALQAEKRGDSDAYLARLNPTGSALVYSTFFGSSFTGNNGYDERGLGIALDAGGNVYLTGQVLGTDLSTNLPLQNRYGGGLSDGFIARIGAPDIITLAPVSAASFVGAALAPETIVAAFGANLAATTEVASSVPLPTSLQGTSVKIVDKGGTERLAPLFFVSPNQVNFLIPAGTARGAATLSISNQQGSTMICVAQIEAVAPAFFAANANGQGLAAAIALRVKPDGAQSFEPIAQYDPAQQRFFAVPLDLGAEGEQVFLLLFGTGWRQRSALAAVNLRIGGIPLQPSFAGAQGGLVGFDQMNVLLPRNLAGRGEVMIEMMVDGQIGNAVSVNVR
jgi:uncharacterized protein (TIGR03437 family)